MKIADAFYKDSVTGRMIRPGEMYTEQESEQKENDKTPEQQSEQKEEEKTLEQESEQKENEETPKQTKKK